VFIVVWWYPAQDIRFEAFVTFQSGVGTVDVARKTVVGLVHFCLSF